MRILILDIETAPNVVYAWGLFNQNIAINQIDKPGYTLCWAAKWMDSDKMEFGSIRKPGMLAKIHRLLSEADAVVTYNGKKFDIPTLNKEFLLERMNPPAPYKHVDLYKVVRSTFRFASNKLDWICQQLELGKKLEHKGHELWVGCMEGNKADWKTMEEYNRQDVALLEEAYKIIRPWIYSHPSHGAADGIECCPKCGSESFQRRGTYLTTTHKYRRYKCGQCGGWFRGNKTILPRPTRGQERMVNAV